MSTTDSVSRTLVTPPARPARVLLSRRVNEPFPPLNLVLSAHDVARLTRRHRWVLYALTALGRFPKQQRFRGHPIGWHPVVVAPARYVLLPVANAITGYSVKAMERKIERGDWPEGKLWTRAPDGHILIDMMGYQRWVESR